MAASVHIYTDILNVGKKSPKVNNVGTATIAIFGRSVIWVFKKPRNHDICMAMSLSML
jgi:hypothetical protein